MTDISNWHELIHCAKVMHQDLWTGKKYKETFAEYVMVPLNSYQMANLLDALTQSVNTGDWYFELMDIIAVAMEKAGIEELISNTGKKFTYEQVRHRNIEKR